MVVAASAASCQFDGLRPSVDSRTKPVDTRGQDKVTLVSPRTMARSVAAAAHVFSNTSTPRALTTARSGLPSPLKSPAAMDAGFNPAPKFNAASKVPSPLPRRSDTLPERSLATATSSLPSPLKSAVVTDNGPSPAV